MARLSLEERFWSKVFKTESCWYWRGCGNRRGYGVFYTGGLPRMLLAHRAAYELCAGTIPTGLQLDHLCREPSCVNPRHLEPVTNRENTARGIAHMHLGKHERIKTHCAHGHEYTEENTGHGRQSHGGPMRYCRQCKKHKSYLKKKQQVTEI